MSEKLPPRRLPDRQNTIELLIKQLTDYDKNFFAVFAGGALAMGTITLLRGMDELRDANHVPVFIVFFTLLTVFKSTAYEASKEAEKMLLEMKRNKDRHRFPELDSLQFFTKDRINWFEDLYSRYRLHPDREKNPVLKKMIIEMVFLELAVLQKFKVLQSLFGGIHFGKLED